VSSISFWFFAVISDPLFCSVWSQISASLANLRSVFSQNEKVAEGLKQFTLKLASPAAERIGWEFKPDEDYLIVQLRKLLIAMACNAGHEG
jgi:hypothetical protein